MRVAMKYSLLGELPVSNLTAQKFTRLKYRPWYIKKLVRVVRWGIRGTYFSGIYAIGVEGPELTSALVLLLRAQRRSTMRSRILDIQHYSQVIVAASCRWYGLI